MTTVALSCNKKLSALLRGITSDHYGNFYCPYCLHSFRTKNKLESLKRICENKYFCNMIIPSEDIKILEFNQYQKSDKAPLVIYADLECLIEKIDGCKNNPENSPTTKVSKHIPSGFSKPTIPSFRSIENKHNVYRGKDCMKKVCESLREHEMEIIDKLLTKEHQESYENEKICYSICSLKYSVPKKIPVAFHNGSMIIILS